MAIGTGIQGYVLAGGQSARFGSDKARVLVHGKPLILHVTAALEPFAGPAAAVVDRPGRVADLGLREVLDGGEHRGPLAGLKAALEDAAPGWIALVPCDVIGLRAEWLEVLRTAVRAGDLAVAFRDDRWHPLPGLYHTDLLPHVLEKLEQGDGALWRLLEHAHARAVPVPEGWRALARIDTPADLQAWLVRHPEGQGRGGGMRKVGLLEVAEPTASVAIERVQGQHRAPAQDLLAIEEPLEIRVEFWHEGRLRRQSLSVTMRTPGHDFELAAGFLLGEGIVRGPADLVRLEHCGQGPARGNVVRVELARDVQLDVAKLQRNFYTTSSCGVCGKASLEALGVSGCTVVTTAQPFRTQALHGLPEQMRSTQAVFQSTGGLHAAGLFTPDGRLEAVREDVGRHNAVDKLIGSRLLNDQVPLSGQGLLLSGRASFEIVQKAVVAGIPLIAAVGAPSSLAVQTAEAFGLTLVGFLRDNRFNVYAGGDRLQGP